MGTVAETEISRFWQELLKQLRDLPALCIVGYDFHAGYGLPHFRDTIMGVWSTADVPNNPFLHPDQASVVLRWADARRNIALRCAQFRNIPAYDQKKSVSQLAYLQQMLGFKVADQSPDGFLAASQLAEVIELYGCVTRGRCIRCGEVADGWVCDASGASSTKCAACGEAVFPDMAMFGWNNQGEALRAVEEAIKESSTLLLIGVDPFLMPFGSHPQLIQDKQIIEFIPGRMVLREQKKTVPLIDIAKMIYKKEDNMLKEIERATGSIDETIGMFYELCRKWERMAE